MMTPEHAKRMAEARHKARLHVKTTSNSRQNRREGLPPDIQAKIDARAAQIPTKRRGVYLRAMSGKSRKAATRAFCYECVGWEDLPDSVRSCTAPACPLYPYRPGA